MLWWVVPFDRDEFAVNVHENWARQSVKVGLIVVQNCGATYDQPATAALRSAERGIAPAMAAGVAMAQKLAHPGDWIAKIDSDDWYGPEYSAQILELQALGTEWSGMPVHEIELQDGRCGLMGHASSTECIGGTLAARADLWEPMGPYLPHEPEDGRWCRAMASAGHVFAPREPGQYRRIRRPGSLDPSSDAALITLFGMVDPDTGIRVEPTPADYTTCGKELRATY